MLDELLKHLKEITINLHVHYHGDNETLHLLRELKSQGVSIMATQKELADDLKAVKDQVAKIGEESSKTLQKVTDLEAALANAGNTTPEVDQAMAALKAQVQLVDDLTPDPLPPA